MGLVVTYYMPADATSGPWTEDLSSAVRLGTIDGIVDEAELGAVGISSLLFDDPDGTLGTSHYSDGIRGLKRIWIDETACPPGDQRLFTGWFGDRRYRRGTDSLILGVARKLDATLVDSNTMLSFRVFAPVNGSNATLYNASNSFVRPAETDLERVNALLTDVAFLTSVHDTGFISTGVGVDMDACDYTGQTAADALNDCAQQSGRNFFIRYDETANEFSLHYVDDGDITDAATLRISNVLADVDNVTTFAPEPDAELVRDPSRVAAAEYLPFNGDESPAYQTRIQTEYDYGWRDATAPSSNVKTLAKANVRAQRYLLQDSTEDDRITCTVRLPANVVTGIKQGQVVQAKFSHLPNGSNAVWGSAFQWCRVLNRNVMANEQTNVLYNVRLELSPISPPPGPLLIAFITSGDSGNPGGVGVSEPAQLNRTGTGPGDWTRAVWTGNFSDYSQWPTNSGDFGLSVWWRHAIPGEDEHVLRAGHGTYYNGVRFGGWVFQVAGVGDPSATVVGNDVLSPLGYPVSIASTVSASVSDAVFFGGFALQKPDYVYNTVIVPTDGTLVKSVNRNNVDTGSTWDAYADQWVPTMWIGYDQGTGTLTIGGTITSMGEGGGPGFTLAGRGWGGLVLPLAGTFSIVQQGFASTTLANGDLQVSLPSPP